jgi:hypothetical protein
MLPLDDPLFISEFNEALAGLEDSTMLREFGLIRANADGFEDLPQKFVARSVSHLFGLASSVQSNATEALFQMTGWSGDGAPGTGTLRDVPTGAVVQHFPRTLDPVECVDFRLPGDAELDALEAFMLSLGVPATQASTVSINSEGESVTVQITSDSEFAGAVATSISQMRIGQVAQGKFFNSTGETVWIEADLPAGF